jgi:hypothetical protein
MLASARPTMNLPSVSPARVAMLALALSLGACATGELDGELDDAAVTDAPANPPNDVPTFDLVNPLDDVRRVDTGKEPIDLGTPDTGFIEPDAGTPDAGTPDVGTPDVGTPDVGTPDVGTPDVGTPDVGGCATGETMCGGGCVDLQTNTQHCGRCGRACGDGEACTAGSCSATCAAPRRLCGTGETMRCVDLQTDAANCGACGMACSAGGACAAGRCATATCMTNASDCNRNSADGCEVIHGTAANTCAAALNLGAFCGDTACALFCPSRSLRVVATRTGTRTTWFRGRLNECSSCPASLNGRLTLRGPPGVDYDLFVYSACGRLIGSSQRLAGVDDTYTLTGGGSFGSDSSDFFVEVRWFSGASCMPFTLTFEARSNSATSC